MCHLSASLLPASGASPDPSTGSQVRSNPLPFQALRPHRAHSSPSTHRDRNRNSLITKSFFIEQWVGDRDRGALEAIPRLAEGSGVGSHPASSRAPQGGAWPPGPGCGAGCQAGVDLGWRVFWSRLPGRAAVSPERPPEGSRPPAQRNSRLLR